jgi:hypothetical protein
MVPPQGEAMAAGEAVDMARRPAAVAFFMKGHKALDWRRTESMAVESGTLQVEPVESSQLTFVFVTLKEESTKRREKESGDSALG